MLNLIDIRHSFMRPPPSTTSSFIMMEGSPTITFELEDSAKMLPYFTLLEANILPGVITLHFTEWIVEISGQRLEKLWQHLAIQDVSVIRCSQSDQDRCPITSITLTALHQPAE